MRKTKLVDCDPSWVTDKSGTRNIAFDCPEGHRGCRKVIPFTPPIDGASPDGIAWTRTGDSFATLSLSPSIRSVPKYESREAAIADGVRVEYAAESMWCALHIFVTNGEIQFCGDSK